jgi:hypothetical protein
VARTSDLLPQWPDQRAMRSRWGAQERGHGEGQGRTGPIDEEALSGCGNNLVLRRLLVDEVQIPNRI